MSDTSKTDIAKAEAEDRRRRAELQEVCDRFADTFQQFVRGTQQAMAEALKKVEPRRPAAIVILFPRLDEPATTNGATRDAK